MKASPDYELKNKKEGPKSPKEANTMKPMTASIKKKKPQRPMSNSMSFL